MNAMRMEKAFKGAGELTNEVTLPEADVMRFVKTDKDFIGKAPTLAQEPRWLCAYLEIEVDGEADGNGGEAVLHQGKVVGATASVVYGHRSDKLIAFAYIHPEAAQAGTALEVLILGASRKATVLDAPVYDPGNALPRKEPLS